MEKKIGSKEVKMKTNEEDKDKLSYEELMVRYADLSQQAQKMQQYIQKLHTQMQQMVNELQIKRMDYLFKVIKYQTSFSSNFVVRCTQEIEESLTIPVQEGDDEQKEEGK